jgi:predicted transcriptional regulator
MKTVRLEVRPLEDAAADFASAWKTGRAEKEARISFETPELLWKVLTAKRWELLKAMAGQEPMTIREVADRVGRDVKAVHSDVRALVDAGVLERGTGGRRVIFPYDAVHVDFVVKAA